MHLPYGTYRQLPYTSYVRSLHAFFVGTDSTHGNTRPLEASSGPVQTEALMPMLTGVACCTTNCPLPFIITTPVVHAGPTPATKRRKPGSHMQLPRPLEAHLSQPSTPPQHTIAPATKDATLLDASLLDSTADTTLPCKSSIQSAALAPGTGLPCLALAHQEVSQSDNCADEHHVSVSAEPSAHSSGRRPCLARLRRSSLPG
jgi:hypothetical protein